MMLEQLERQTLENTYFRQDLSTAQDAPLVVHVLAIGRGIGDEVQPNVKRFFRIGPGQTLTTSYQIPSGFGLSQH
jgi:hypothetical protein